MLLQKPFPAAKNLIFHLNSILAGWQKNTLSNKQCLVVSAMALSGQLNWAWIARASLGGVGTTALSWMLRLSKIPWELLLRAAAYHLLRLYEVAELRLVVNDTDRPRSKIIKKLYGVFKTFDKKTGGYFQAQNIVFVLVVTKVFTFPIAFKFFRPDPVYSAWLKEVRKLRKKKVPKEQLPADPIRDHQTYPTRTEIAASLLLQVQKFLAGITVLVHGQPTKIRIATISADVAYFSNALKNEVRRLFNKALFVSQLKRNQLVCDRRGVYQTIETYFAHRAPTEATIRLRGGSQIRGRGQVSISVCCRSNVESVGHRQGILFEMVD